MDGDMLLRDDINKLWELRDETKAVQVVKHDYKTKMTEKYLGSKNENYPRKNWSSVIVWNCYSHPNRKLTPEFIEKSTGAELHRFTWIEDSRIMELPKEWNWLVQEDGPNPDAKLLHFSSGVPLMPAHANSPHAADYMRQVSRMNHVTD